MSKELIRAAGGIVHSHGNIFFTNQALLDAYVAAITQPVRPLTAEQIRWWWGNENGLEDCDMCKIDDFTQVVRAVEAYQGNKMSNEPSDMPHQLFDATGQQVCPTATETCRFYEVIHTDNIINGCSYCERGIPDNRPHRLCPAV